MHLKYMSLAALLGIVGAQELQGLNATLAGNEQLSTLAGFINSLPPVLSTLEQASNITILAPSNQAFDKVINTTEGQALSADPSLLQALLQYHVVGGTVYAQDLAGKTEFIPTLLTNTSYTNVTGGQRVEVASTDDKVTFFSGLLQNSSVTQANVNFTGGTIHIIDTVLTVPVNVSSTALGAGLTTLYGALDEADLVGTVDETPDVTIFAPTNQAFQAIGSALSNLTKQELSNILTYHVIKGTVGYSTGLQNGASLETVNGGRVKITIEDGTVFVNSAKVVIPNVLVANGVVHVIDNVLNPSDANASPSPSATQGAPAFPSASSAEIPFATDVPKPTVTVPATGASKPTGTAASTAPQGAAMAMKTGMAIPAMLFGGAAAAMMNL